MSIKKEAEEIFSSKHTIPELRELGKKYEINMPSRIKKADLIELLISEYVKKSKEDKPKEDTKPKKEKKEKKESVKRDAKKLFNDKKTIKELKELGKKYNLYFTSNVNKEELIAFLRKEYIFKYDVGDDKYTEKQPSTKKSSSKKSSTKKSTKKSSEKFFDEDSLYKEAIELFSMSKTIPELKKLGEKYGIKIPPKINKSDLINLLRDEYMNNKREENIKKKMEENNYTEDDYVSMLILHQIILKDIPELKITLRICYIAINVNGLELEYVPKHYISDNMIKIAVLQNGLALQFVQENMKTYDICAYALRDNPDAIRYIPIDILRKILSGKGEQSPRGNRDFEVPSKNKQPNEEQKRKYKYLVARLHPDKNPHKDATKVFQELNEKYQAGNFNYIERIYDGYIEQMKNAKKSSIKNDLD